MNSVKRYWAFGNSAIKIKMMMMMNDNDDDDDDDIKWWLLLCIHNL